ncbi:hypothetical protein BT69DRAFT_1328021 [Atractiella rhizophila]|nr:hypothetical protein BT69DRAFT_1328021 [Atractiella rhizophila]
MLRITFVLPLEFWREYYELLKLSYFSLAGIKNEVEPDGAVILCIVLEEECITVAFGDTKRCIRGIGGPVLFEPVALYLKEQQRFIPLSEWEESTIPSTFLGTTIQLFLPTTQPTGIGLCSITHLPPEVLSLIFEFLSFNESEMLIEGTGYLVSYERLSAVCQLWKAVSASYLSEVSVKEMYARLTAYPNAGRLWTYLLFESEDDDISIAMAKGVIAGSPNVILTRLDDVMFRGQGWRKWKKDEVENFMSRMGDRIRTFHAFDVEDSASSTSPALQLSSDLEGLELLTYPPLPFTLTWLELSYLCPLPQTTRGRRLRIALFFGAWRGGEIRMARSALRDFDVSEKDKYTWVWEGGEE